VLRTRQGRISPDALAERLIAQGFRLAPKTGLPGFFEIEDGPGPVTATLEHWLGLFYVQQASTGIAAPVLDPQPGERVLDMCSAPGGKTTHAADLMEDRGCLVAAEISDSRIRGLLSNVYRMGHSNILVIRSDGRDFPEGALFDRVLVDAPCGGEGTLRRKGGKSPYQSAAFKTYVTGTQRGLLERAVRLTRPGGTILYVTCTFAPEENEAVVDQALRTLPVELEPIDLPMPHARGLTEFDGKVFDPRLQGAARIYPHHIDSGGLFLAKLIKLDDGDSGGQQANAWGPVPSLFPTPDEQVSPEAVDELVRIAVEELVGRFGVPPAFAADLRWALRGGRLWIHTLDEWPMAAWSDGPWRPISVGFRAMEFDSRGRPRPTNDFLIWLGGQLHERVCDVSAQELLTLGARGALPMTEEILGPVALRYRGEIIGRGAGTQEGLKSEISKARATDLERSLAGD